MHPAQSASKRPLGLAIAGIFIFLIGAAVGFSRATRVNARSRPAIEDHLTSLREELEDLRALLAASQSDLQERSHRPSVDERQLALPPEELLPTTTGSAREPAENASDGSEASVSWQEDLRGGMAAIEAMEKRLDRMEKLQREFAERLWAQIAVGALGPQALPEIPPGTSVRDYLRALKEVGGVEQVHQLWTTQRVLSTYGQPDEIAEREDYIEWIYRLPEEGEQFDFHFVNGLCVQAH